MLRTVIVALGRQFNNDLARSSDSGGRQWQASGCGTWSLGWNASDLCCSPFIYTLWFTAGRSSPTRIPI